MTNYTLEETDQAGGIFLAGPSFRPDQKGESWRKEAVKIINILKINPVIYVPEYRPTLEDSRGKQPEFWTFEKQVEWECKYLFKAQTIMFWIPRSESLPGFTTNIEFGEWLHSDKIVIGFPDDAINMRYIRHRCAMRGIPVYNNIQDTCIAAVQHNWKYNAQRRDN